MLCDYQDNQYTQHFTDLESNSWDTVNLPLKNFVGNVTQWKLNTWNSLAIEYIEKVDFLLT